MHAPHLMAIVGMLGAAQAAPTPPSAARIRVSLNGVEQVPARRLAQNFSVTKNLEPVPIVADIERKRTWLFDVGGSVRLVDQLAIGVSVAARSHRVGGTLD